MTNAFQLSTNMSGIGLVVREISFEIQEIRD